MDQKKDIAQERDINYIMAGIKRVFVQIRSKFDSYYSFRNAAGYDRKFILSNHDFSKLRESLKNLSSVVVDTETYDFYNVERFVTYANNHIGTNHLKNKVKVHIYGDPTKLHENLKNLFENMFREVVFYKRAAA
jgi:3-dehydroquinate dehydratase